MTLECEMKSIYPTSKLLRSGNPRMEYLRPTCVTKILICVKDSKTILGRMILKEFAFTMTLQKITFVIKFSLSN